MTIINGVLGPIDSKELGFTLMHDHILACDWTMRQSFPNWFDKDIFIEKAPKALIAAKKAGVNTIVDVTPIDLGRDINIIYEIAKKAEMQVIAATGFYKEMPWMFGKEEDEIIKLLVNDIEKGIQGTKIKASIIKCATFDSGLTTMNKKLLSVCAKAHLYTGAPITTHTQASNKSGILQQDVFEENGVNLKGVIIGHCGDSNDIEYLETILKRGSYIGMDRFGLLQFNPLENRIATIKKLCKLGWEDKIVLSHDLVLFSDAGNSKWDPKKGVWFTEAYDEEGKLIDFTYISKVVIPKLLEAGISENQIKSMTIDNPCLIFEES